MAFLARCFVLISLLAVYPFPASAESIQLAEQKIKAALLYNFLKYTDWPMPDTQMEVCLFGGDPFNGYLQHLEGRSVNQQPIHLRMLKQGDTMDSCRLLFINPRHSADWVAIQQSLKGKPILTVSDFNGFTESGGMIGFGSRNNHITANLNMNALVKAGLKVQERLLKLVTVQGEDG